MKITCKKNELVQAVTNVSRAVSAKSTIPALEGIFLKTQDHALLLYGYDLELGITTTIEAEIQEEGSLILPAKLFTEMVRKMSEEQITVCSDSNFSTLITSGTTEFSIVGMNPVDYPELPTNELEHAATLDKETLQSMIEQTLFAVATGDTKPVHTGSLFEVKEEMLTVVSVDGYRLAIRKEPAKGTQDCRFIVPGKTLSEVAKLIGNGEGTVSIHLAQRHILFDIQGYQVLSRLLEGDFLDYHAAVPKSTATTVRLPVRLFTDSVERTSLLISDRLKSPLKLQFSETKIEVSCETAMGKARDSFPCQLEGPPLTMGFNNKYLLDALRHTGCDEIKLQLNGPLAPMKIVPAEEADEGKEKFLFLVLPVRLKYEP